MTFLAFLTLAAVSPQQAPAREYRPEELEVVRLKTAYTLPADVAEVDVVFFSGRSSWRTTRSSTSPSFRARSPSESRTG